MTPADQRERRCRVGRGRRGSCQRHAGSLDGVASMTSTGVGTPESVPLTRFLVAQVHDVVVAVPRWPPVPRLMDRPILGDAVNGGDQNTRWRAMLGHSPADAVGAPAGGTGAASIGSRQCRDHVRGRDGAQDSARRDLGRRHVTFQAATERREDDETPPRAVPSHRCRCATGSGAAPHLVARIPSFDSTSADVNPSRPFSALRAVFDQTTVVVAVRRGTTLR